MGVDAPLREGIAVVTDFQCAGCARAFGHGRALYVPTHKLWFHRKCFKLSTLPEGTRAFEREPTAESLERFAAHDAKFVASH